jgi:uncharacterized protein (TIGR01319 family)
MRAALLIDFGSTYTKLRAINLDTLTVLGSGQGPSTVLSDVTVGMQLALDDLESRMGSLPHFMYRLASSSAAGGLKMVTIGLVRELTLEAARRAALGAGAKLVGGFAGRMNASDIERVRALMPDIILLAGGTDGGDMNVVIHNAGMLGASDIAVPIVFAGNRSAVDEVSQALRHKHMVTTENVMPELNQLHIDPARAAIRQVFIERIVHAKGIDRARELFDAVLMPTPAAVLEGARLLADGPGGSGGLGDLVVLDPGGATTDVHSVASGKPSTEGVVQVGLPEPRVKRTVEGDLGMRHNAAAIVAAAGEDRLAREAALPIDQLSTLLAAFEEHPERLPQTEVEQRFDDALARSALQLAMRRHCGSLEVVYTANGPVTAQTGKDLTQVGTIIGTGGVLAHSRDPAGLLEAALYDPQSPNFLCPRGPRLLIDSRYLLYASGLLSQVDPDAAFALMQRHLEPAGTKGARPSHP